VFFDTREVDDGSVLRATVCVVGGGVAGITLALEFERQGVDTILVESGGFTPDEAVRDLYRGENVGVPYVFADGCRSRYFGGSSNCWGGWCRPLSAHEMAPREWIPESGWPFDRAALEPFYQRAHPVLSLGPNDYDVERWVTAIGRPDVQRVPLPTGQVRDMLSQIGSPLALGEVYRKTLERAKRVRVYLYANAVDIRTDPDATAVLQVRLKTLSGRSVTVESSAFVLACGGIENARLLLTSDTVQPGGLGNANDLVGRYFADHPRASFGTVRLGPHWSGSRLYDVSSRTVNNVARAVSANGALISGHFCIDTEVQRRERLLHAQLWLSAVVPGEDTVAAEAIIRMRHRQLGKSPPGPSFWDDVALLAGHPAAAARFLAGRLLYPRSRITELRIAVACEPSPDRESRVTLSDLRDQLGMRRVRVNWRLGEDVRHTIDRSVAIFAEELRTAGLAEVDSVVPLEGRAWPGNPATPWHNLGTWHHMGTTRMHDSPGHGVVDRDCRVHGLANLYVAGSSVFPTYGANMPTLTIAALSLRLADHIAATTDAVRALG
jgi:choline dehydrogenase-like flavoprotein